MADQIPYSENSTKPARPAARQPGATPLRVFKPGQGKHVRWGTAIFTGVVAVAGARFLYEWLGMPFPDAGGSDLVWRTLIPVAVLVIVGYVIFLMVGRKRATVDFMIATEGEMKKVNWSSRKEVFGATRVVIFSVLALGSMLFVVDLLFMLVFSLIGILQIPVWERLFGSST
ncbi:MAG: preprotein translocase subunit SecE [Planctomycetota bacterium]